LQYVNILFWTGWATESYGRQVCGCYLPLTIVMDRVVEFVQ